MTRPLLSHAASLGGLRLLLFVLAVSAALAAPDPGARTVIAWPLVVPTLIAPAIAPIIFVIVLLDLVMVKVRPGARSRFTPRVHAMADRYFKW